MTRLSCGFVILLLGDGVAAQQKPDFSGRWTDEPEATEEQGGPGQQRGAGGQRGAGRQRGAGQQRRGDRGRRSPIGDMGSGWGSTLTVEQNADRLTVEYAFFRRADRQPPLSFAFALDGSATESSVCMGRGYQVQRSRTRWDDDKLVITTVHVFEHPATREKIPYEVTRTLSLESPESMVVEVTRSGLLGGQPTRTRTTYRRI